jgi:glutaredoxin 3
MLKPNSQSMSPEGQTAPARSAVVTIYTAQLCPYCDMARDLLARKGVAFDEIDVTDASHRRAEMRTKAGGRNTVPQIWIGLHHVGGCDDLYALDRAGKLDALLAG